MVNKFNNRSDNTMNSALKSEVQGLRGAIGNTAEKQPMPERFEATPLADDPSIMILDTETGKSTIVPIFAYREVRKALNELFG
ncbi:hypothetical protein D3C81_384480 [compost metagenome]